MQTNILALSIPQRIDTGADVLEKAYNALDIN